MIALIEYLNGRQTGIVDTWLPGRTVLVVDRGEALDISTCIDNPSLPATSVVWSEAARAYLPTQEWRFGDLPLDISITRTDNELSLKVTFGTYDLAFAATRLTDINNSFMLSGDVIDGTHLTDIACGAVTTDAGGSTLQLTAYYQEAFMHFAFPVATSGTHAFDYDAVRLVSSELDMLLNPVIASAQASIDTPAPAQVQLSFDLTTDDAVQLHGEATLNRLTLP